MKRCRVCGETKPLGDFYRAAGGKDGRRSECKRCNSERRKIWYQQNREVVIERVRVWQRENKDRLNAYRRERNASRRAEIRAQHLLRAFGLTVQEFERLKALQGGGCAICGGEPATGSLHVDHEHESGRVRGLLCMRRNNALGLLRDDADLLLRAADYVDSETPNEARHRLDALANVRARELVGAGRG